MPEQARVRRILRPSTQTSLPFLLCASLGVATLAFPPYETRLWQWLLALPLMALVLAAQAVVIRRDRRTWVDPVPALLYFLVVAVLRDTTGAANSGLAPLVALPILWLAVYGVRRDLEVAAVLNAVIFLAPVVLVGPPTYPPSDWRRAATWTAITLLVGPVIQRIVAAWQTEVDLQQRTSAERRAILDGARLSAIVACDLDGVVTSFGVGAEAVIGYRASDVVDVHTPLLWHDPAEVAVVAGELGVEPGIEVFRHLARTDGPSRIWTLVRADGERRWVRLALTELRDSTGHPLGFLGVANDSTETVRAHRDLTEVEQRWRILLDNLPDLTVLLVSEDLTVDLVTGAGAMRQGLSGAAGKPLAEVAPPPNDKPMLAMVKAALGGEESILEMVSVSTGHEFEVLVTPLLAQQRPQALILARDVSDERSRERELLRAKERAERLFLDAPQGIAVLGIDGAVRQVNPSLCTLLDREAELIVGRGLSSLADNPLDRTVARHLHDVLEQPAGATGSGGVVTEWTARTPDGRRVYVTLSSTLLRMGDGDDVILVNVTDVSDRHGMEEQLAHLADHDPLTGLANRRRFDAELKRHLDYCRRYGPIGAVVVLDLDHFKEVNDTLGHAAGDDLIVAIAAVLRRGVRGTDVVARLGGDEFAVLLPQADRTGAEIVAQGIVDRVRNHVQGLDGTLRKVTASVGVVVIDAANEDPGELMAAADMVMYDAKENGRDGYVILDFAAYQQPKTGARMEWQSRIENAIEHDLFALHLQPILDLATDRVTGAEVLLRMVDGDELVMPAEFLYVAERSHLIVELDCWVVDHAIGLLRELRLADPDFRLEVNVSGRSMGHPTLERAVVDALERHGVAADGLVLEVTETSAVADVEVARRFAERMSAAGCEFALDDFGAGFGSFYYLKHLVFDYVKIDGEFVASVHENPADRLILNSIVGIARGLGKRTVAEFVGSRAVLDVVRAEGVDYAQGYHVGRPVPAHEFPATLSAPDPGRAAR